MKIIYQSTTDKAEIRKALSTDVAIKDFVGETLTVTGILTYEKEETDKVTTLYVVNTEEHGWCFTNSNTVKDVLDVIILTSEQEDIEAGIEVDMKTSKSGKGRDFYFLEIK